MCATVLFQNAAKTSVLLHVRCSWSERAQPKVPSRRTAARAPESRQTRSAHWCCRFVDRDAWSTILLLLVCFTHERYVVPTGLFVKNDTHTLHSACDETRCRGRRPQMVLPLGWRIRYSANTVGQHTLWMQADTGQGRVSARGMRSPDSFCANSPSGAGEPTLQLHAVCWSRRSSRPCCACGMTGATCGSVAIVVSST